MNRKKQIPSLIATIALLLLSLLVLDACTGSSGSSTASQQNVPSQVSVKNIDITNALRSNVKQELSATITYWGSLPLKDAVAVPWYGDTNDFQTLSLPTMKAYDSLTFSIPVIPTQKNIRVLYVILMPIDGQYVEPHNGGFEISFSTDKKGVMQQADPDAIHLAVGRYHSRYCLESGQQLTPAQTSPGGTVTIHWTTSICKGYTLPTGLEGYGLWGNDDYNNPILFPIKNVRDFSATIYTLASDKHPEVFNEWYTYVIVHVIRGDTYVELIPSGFSATIQLV